MYTRDLDCVLPSNRLLVDLYLDHPIQQKLDLLLCSVRPFTGNLDVNLRQKILPYLEYEEARIQQNLESVAFEVDTPATLTLIAGPSRIESASRWLPAYNNEILITTSSVVSVPPSIPPS